MRPKKEKFEQEQLPKNAEQSPDAANSPSRRKALKALTAISGATALSMMPGKWQKPIITTGTLPAFAQSSPIPPLGTGDLQVTLSWDTGNTGNRVDIDNHVVEPNGTRVYYANPTGPTAELDVDNVVGMGPENIFVAAGTAAPGVYRVQVVYYFGNQITSATIQITLFSGTAQEVVRTFTRTLTSANSGLAINVANITFPSGDIQELTGEEVLGTNFIITK